MMVQALSFILAAGFFAPDSGTEARALGGTGAGNTDTGIAVWYNPAALAGQKGIGILIDGNVLFMSQTFERAGTNPDTGQPYASVKGNPPPQIIPALVGTYNVIEDRLTIAVGAVAPTGPRQKFPEDGAQRFNLVEQWLVQVNYGVWAAYKFNRWFGIGAGFEGQYNSVEQLAIGSSADDSVMPTEDPFYDLPLQLTASQAFTPTGNIGVQLTPPLWQGWSFGMSYRPPVHVVAPGELEVQSPLVPDPVPIEMRYATPGVFRVGASLDRHKFTFKADLVVEDWSQHEDVVVDFDDNNPLVLGGILPTEQPIRHNFHPAYSLRLGYGRDLTDSLRLLTGYYFESGAVPSEYMGVDSFDNAKHGLNVGASMKLGEKLRLSAAYSFVYVQARDVDNTDVAVLAPFASSSFLVGNGSYSGFYNMASLAAYLSF